MVLRDAAPKGRLRPIDIEAVMSASDADQHFGTGALEHFSWKDVLDLYSCTECGRCQSHCPAYLTGKMLSPKTLITDLRDAAYERLKGGYAATRHSAHVVQETGSTGRQGGRAVVTQGTGAMATQGADEPAMWVSGVDGPAHRA